MRKAAGRLAIGCLILSFLAPAPGVEGARGQDPKATPPGLDAYRRAVLDARGDPGRGRHLFEDAKRTRCVACHAVDGRGGRIGPDLTGVGGRLAGPELIEAILEPSAKLHPDYSSTTIATRSGRVLRGIVRPVGESEVEVVTSETESVRLAVGDIEEQRPDPVSPMPAGLHEGLAPSEMADLVEYLARLDLPGPAGPHEAGDAREIPRASRPVAFRPVHGPSIAFDRPVWLGPVPGHPGTFAVAEIASGRIWLLEEGPGGARKTPFADLSGEITAGKITGVMALAFHPDYARNRRYFVKLHGPREGGRLAVHVVERRADEGGLRDSGGPSRLILKIPVFSEIHNGGQVAFGPDGLLYIGMGDTGPQGDPRGHARDLGVLLGKMLRIDVDRAEGGRPYAIPPDNPFRGRAGALPEVWAYGLREPWRFSFDPPTGDLWVGDVGQGRFEEVGIVRAGEDHGWNVIEGFRPHSEQYRSSAAGHVPPVFAYSHRVGVSVTGGFVYRGGRLPALRGRYVFGDYETRRVWALTYEGRKFSSIVEIGRSPERIVSFGVDGEGELYVVGFDRGVIYRLDPAGADLAAVESREVAPTARLAPTSWRYTLRSPAAAWAGPGFDDASWTAAPGGFGGREKAGAVVRTEWRSPDIWLRREVALPRVDPGSLTLSVHHDEDAEIYINGVLAAELAGYGDDYDDAVPISPGARAAIREGRNVLAVHCRQTRGGQYIDVGIVETMGRPGPGPAGPAPSP